MNKLSTVIIITAVLFLQTGGCSSEKPESGVQTAPVAEKKEAAETKAAEVPVPAAGTGVSGESLFNKHCVKCHKNGGNAINPEKTLRRKDLAANNISTPEDIIRIMRNPGKGMMRFSEEKVSDEDAKKIGEYILKTFQ